jgi:hypothetical protein
MDRGIHKKIFLDDADLNDFFRDSLKIFRQKIVKAQKIVAWIALKKLGYCEADRARYLVVTTS